jgi:hypothetical protein
MAYKFLNWKGRYQSEGCDLQRSKDSFTLAASQSLVPGQLIGVVTAEADTYAFVAAAAAGNTGNATITGISAGPGFKGGVGKVIALSANEAEVLDKDGHVMGVAKAGVAFAGEINLTLTAGSTPLVAGDSYTLTATPTAPANIGEAVAWNPTATDGSEIAVGVSWDFYTGAGVTADIVAHVRDCRVWDDFLFYNGATDLQIAAAKAQLAAKGLIVA